MLLLTLFLIILYYSRPILFLTRMACEPFISVGLGVMLPKPFASIVGYSMASYYFLYLSPTLLLLDLFGLVVLLCLW